MTTTTVTINEAPSLLDRRCIECFQKTYGRLLQKYKLRESQLNDFQIFLQKTVAENNALSTPEIQQVLYEYFSRMVGSDDLFYIEKKNSNRIALELYQTWKPKVINSKNPFKLALRLAIAGNIMDYGANHEFNIHKTIKQVLQFDFDIDHSQQLQERIKQAKHILYLGDNAGEIVFDRLFIETIERRDIVYVVKSGAILNDAIMKDATDVCIHNAATIIENGDNAPSTVLSQCSPEFLNLFDKAELIISKGQGNLEGLINEHDPRIFFLLMVKCDVIAERLNVKKDSLLAFNPGVALDKINASKKNSLRINEVSSWKKSKLV
jgi:damage-control phosphatase, subfamily I